MRWHVADMDAWAGRTSYQRRSDIPASRLPDPFAWRIASAPGSFPALSISKSHSGNFLQGQTGASYTITVSDSSSGGRTNGTISVTEALPTGLTLMSMTGNGWSCSGITCTRADVLHSGSAFPAIIVTTDVSSTAASQITNRPTVSGGGSAPATASDLTNVVAMAAPQVIATASKDAFTSQTGPNIVTGFEDVPVNSFAPFVSNGVSFASVNSTEVFNGAKPQVINSLLGNAFSFWFPNDGTGSQFMLTNGAFLATFPTDVHAVGFDYSCFACSAIPTDKVIQWQLLSASGAVVASGPTVADFTSGLHFFGLQSSAVFRSISIIGDVTAAGNAGNWLADNVRYAQ